MVNPEKEERFASFNELINVQLQLNLLPVSKLHFTSRIVDIYIMYYIAFHITAKVYFQLCNHYIYKYIYLLPYFYLVDVSSAWIRDML